MIHRVEAGEHIAGIAVAYGFSDWRTIWEHPENASLRDLRENPSVLHPGDRLFVPERVAKDESAETGRLHSFTRKGDALRLRIVLLDVAGEPVREAACTLEVGGRERQLVTDSLGMIDEPIGKSVVSALLTVEERGLRIPLQVGHLDPVEEESGLRARLANLGYLAASEGGVGDEDGGGLPALRLALEEFQCDNGLGVDGQAGEETLAKLVEVHGS